MWDTLVAYKSYVSYGKQYQNVICTASPQPMRSSIQGLTRAGARLRQAVGFAAWLTVGAAFAAEPTPELVRLYYDLEVLGYCGMGDTGTGAAFEKQREQIMTRHGIDDPGMQESRMEAWKQAYREWDNRGLGGFRNWCRTEGAAAAHRLQFRP